MNAFKILVVDDEVQILRALKTNLEARDYKVWTARDGEEAIRLIGDVSPDLLILDLGLPKKSGLDVLRSLRSWSDIPVIIVSARDGDPDKIAALDEGADDYLTKPFSIGELMARVRAALRRRVQVELSPVVSTPDFEIDFARGSATRNGEIAHLTPLEWKIVSVLVHSEGRLVTQRSLLSEVWGPEYDNESGYLRVHMTHIRRKLEPEPARPRYFRTEPGIGYRFNSDGALR
jgi:two-component system KDP operon response regulator KdpE